MRVNSVRLFQFRNLATQEITFPEQVTLVCGQNGQGKTSLLEALYTAAHTRSFRNAKLKELIRWQAEEARVELSVETADGTRELEYRLGSTQREMRVNGSIVQRASSYYGNLSCIAFTPESMQLVQGGPANRRRFLDRSFSIIEPRHIDLLLEYQRTLKSRNLLLQEHRQSFLRGSAGGEIAHQLGAYEEILAQRGSAISQARLGFVAELEPRVIELYRMLSDEREKVVVRYQSSGFKAGSAASEIYEALRAALEERRTNDCQRGQTSVGPHRDELELLFEFEGRPQRAREFASQGQCRSLALALVLAVMEYLQARSGETPLVLLDDVESELDAARRAALFSLLERFSAQTIITATEPSEALFRGATKAAILSVDRGIISPRGR